MGECERAAVTIWGFVSDIHGNYAALSRAAAWCEGHGVERYVCLGDVIGRRDPEACIEWVRDHAEIAIVGNRDLDYVDRVRPELQAVVRSWPNEGRASDFVVSHGDPKLHKRLNSSGVREELRKAAGYMDELGVRLWLFGHTHNARVWRLSNAGPALVMDLRGTETTRPTPPREGQIQFDRDVCYVVNVGTTGMPLPGKGGAAFATYDDQAKQLRIVSLATSSPAPLRGRVREAT